MTELTPAESNRVRENAWERYGDAQRHRDSWAGTLATNTARGDRTSADSVDAYIAARAAAFEARADWCEARAR